MQGVECEMTDEFFAGLFAGEGYVFLQKGPSGYWLVLGLNMVDLPLIESIERRFGGHISKSEGRRRTPTGAIGRVSWIWHANGNKRPVLEALSKYCTGDKKAQVDLALQYIDDLGEYKTGWGVRRTPEQKQRQGWYYLEMKRLKTFEYLERESSYAT